MFMYVKCAYGHVINTKSKQTHIGGVFKFNFSIVNFATEQINWKQTMKTSDGLLIFFQILNC